MQTKQIWKSRTFILAVLQAAIGIVAVFISSYPDVGTLLILKSVLDVLLRVGTTTSIATAKEEELG